MRKELKGLEDGPKVKIHLNSRRETLKKVTNWKTPGHDGFKISLLSKKDWLYMLTRNRHTRMDDLRQTTLI